MYHSSKTAKRGWPLASTFRDLMTTGQSFDAF
jgi:hypothetical protein